MAREGPLSSLGTVAKTRLGFKAIIETRHQGERYKFGGPPRKREQHASDDLHRIRYSAAESSERKEGLLAMQGFATQLRKEATAGPRALVGSIEEGYAHAHRARI